MTADQVIDQVRHWRTFNYGPLLPSAVVVASRDWLTYVQAMAEAVPREDELAFPSEEDVLWAWPEGVLIVFDQSLTIDHTIISQDMPGTYGGVTTQRVKPHHETQDAAAFAVVGSRLVSTQNPDGSDAGPMLAYPTMWIATDPTDIISGHWTPGGQMLKAPGMDEVSQSSRMALSLITALGHRLTRMEQPVTANRGERRRVDRELPALRVLQLSTGATVARSESGGSVEWSHRWMVRGHWRLQPYGPKRALRKPTWIDPYVKGPEDKPLDVRPTVWRVQP